MDASVLVGGVAVVVAALLGLFGVLIGQLFGRVAHLEREQKETKELLNESQDFVTKLREWAVIQIQLYLQWRRPDAPDPHPLPGRED